MIPKECEDSWLQRMEQLELNYLYLHKIDFNILTRQYIMIDVEGKPFRVRVHIYNKDDKEKKTLVMMHGYLGSSVCWSWMIKPLSEKYRLVLFDHNSWGLNTRLEKCSGFESKEAAEEFEREWVSKVFDKFTQQNIVPDKFLLSGHSMGGFLSSQYASQYPHRVEALFLMSPAGSDPYDEATWDPYKMKDPSYLEQEAMERKKVD